MNKIKDKTGWAFQAGDILTTDEPPVAIKDVDIEGDEVTVITSHGSTHIFARVSMIDLRRDASLLNDHSPAFHKTSEDSFEEANVFLRFENEHLIVLLNGYRDLLTLKDIKNG